MRSYYQLMLSLARQGDPRAQKEYAAWLRRLSRAKRAYADAYENEEVEALAAYGYEVGRARARLGCWWRCWSRGAGAWRAGSAAVSRRRRKPP